MSDDIAWYAEYRWEEVWKIPRKDLDKCKKNNEFHLTIQFSLGRNFFWQQ